MLELEELLTLEGNVPIILLLRKSGQLYQKELERTVGVHGETIKTSVMFLAKKGILEEVPYAGKVPNVKSWLALTSLGEEVADCLNGCRRKLSKINR